MKAYVFPGQGSQFPGMGKELFHRFEIAKEMFHASDEILGFDLSKILLEGTKKADKIASEKVKKIQELVGF